MTFEEFHQFLIDNSGVTVKLISNLFEDNPSPVKSFFFKQYKSLSDPFYRAGTVITDPVILLFVALECLIVAAFYAVKSLVQLTMFEPSNARDSFGGSAAFLLAACIQICAALTAPIINAIDLIGSGINSISESFGLNHTH